MKNEVIPIITKVQFLSASLPNISSVYFGKRDCCRCGCGGTYTDTTFMENPRSTVDNRLVERYLKRAQRIVEKGEKDVIYGDNFVDVQTGVDRCLTFYFDELKKTK